MSAKRLSVCLACACLLTACGELPEGGENPVRYGDGGNLDLRPGSEPAASPGEALDAVASGINDGDGEGIPEFRRRALLEAARERGSRMGYARRGWEIGGLLERRSSQLDRAFDFSRVTAEAPAGAGYVVPPVVSRGIDAFEGDARRRKVSVVDEYLTIASPGEIRPVRPTWRDYLLFERAPPDDPGRAPLPRSQEERTRFAEWFGEGWRAGADLADSEIISRLDRLRRDYAGMLRYRRLVSRGMMDRMVLRDADLGVTGGGGEMRIGDRTVRIVSDAALRADPRRWSVRALRERDIPAALTNPEISNSSNRRNSTAGDDQVSSSEDMPASPSQEAAVHTASDDQVSSLEDMPDSPAQEAASPIAGVDQVSSLEDMPVAPAQEAAVPSSADAGASHAAERPAFVAAGADVSPDTDEFAPSGTMAAFPRTGGYQVADSPAFDATGAEVSPDTDELAPSGTMAANLRTGGYHVADSPAFVSAGAEFSSDTDELAPSGTMAGFPRMGVPRVIDRSAFAAEGADVTSNTDGMVPSGSMGTIPRTGGPQVADRPAFAADGAEMSPSSNSQVPSGPGARIANAAGRLKFPDGGIGDRSTNVTLDHVASLSNAGGMSSIFATRPPASPKDSSPALTDGSGS